MGDIIVGLAIIVILFFAIRSTKKHFKGEGGCCGGGCSECGEKTKKKQLKGEKVAVKVLAVEGMHCDHCKSSVEKSLNEIDGAVAKVNLGKKTATVTLGRMISDEELKKAVEDAGFQVVDIELKEV